MLILVSTIHVVVCLFLIMVVLLQQGKGADLSVFGGGGTQAAFGARGATTLLHKLTVIGFVGFIVTTMVIGLIKTSARSSSVLTDVPAAAAPAVPAETESATEGAAAVDETAAALEGSAPAGAAADATATGAEAEAADGGVPEDGGGDDSQ